MWDDVRKKYYNEKMENLNNENKKSFQILNEVLDKVLVNKEKK